MSGREQGKEPVGERGGREGGGGGKLSYLPAHTSSIKTDERRESDGRPEEELV